MQITERVKVGEIILLNFSESGSGHWFRNRIITVLEQNYPIKAMHLKINRIINFCLINKFIENNQSQPQPHKN